MWHYDLYILRMDVDSITDLFIPDGELGDIAKGRDSIRQFLRNFKNVRVLSQVSVIDSTKINADTAVQYGHYAQEDVMNHKDTMRVKGSFVAKWLWQGDNGWKLKRMDTKPTP